MLAITAEPTSVPTRISPHDEAVIVQLLWDALTNVPEMDEHETFSEEWCTLAEDYVAREYREWAMYITFWVLAAQAKGLTELPSINTTLRYHVESLLGRGGYEIRATAMR